MVVSPTEPVGKSVVQNFLVLLLARIAAIALQVLSFAILASHLGPRGFGVYAFAISLVWIFRILATFGFDTLAIREITQDAGREPTLVPDIVFLRFVLAVASYVLLGLVVIGGGYDEIEIKATLVAGITLFFVTFETLGNSLAARMRFGWPAVATLVEATVSVVGILILAANDAGILAFLWLYGMVKAASTVVVAVAASRQTSFRWRIRPMVWPTLMRGGASLAAAAVLITIYHRVDMTVLARLKSEADVGQYGVAFRFYETLLLIPALIGGVIQPVLGASFVQARSVIARRYARAIDASVLAAIPISIIGGMTAWRVVPALPGLGEYEGAGVALSILSAAAGFAFVSTIAQMMLIVGHLQRVLLVISVLTVAVNLCLITVLIPLASYTGAAISATVTGAFTACLSVLAVRRGLGLAAATDRTARVAVASVPLVVALAFGYLLNPIAQVLLAVMVYAFAAFATGAVAVRDLTPILGRTHGPVSIVVASSASEVIRYAVSLSSALAGHTQVRLVLVGEPLEPMSWMTDADVKEVRRRNPFTLWRALRGSAVCDVHVETRSPLWILLVSRLARCGRLVLTPQEVPPVRHRRFRPPRLSESLIDCVIVRRPAGVADANGALTALATRVSVIAEDGPLTTSSHASAPAPDDAISAAAARTLEIYRSNL